MENIKLLSIVLCFGCSVANELINFSEIPCGTKWNGQSKIVGGANASPGEYPWMVSLTRRGSHFCGGALITAKHVLTAAHCTCNGEDGFIRASSIKVIVGEHDLATIATADHLTIYRITPHLRYKCNRVQNDIAILELQADVTWSENVQPACILSKFIAGGRVIVAGWGWTGENTDHLSKTSILQKANVTVIQNALCQSWYRSQGKKTQIHGSQLCAGRQEGGTDACWADSGGPLMLDEDNSNVGIVGIVSTGIGCGRPYLPGIYTRISEFLPWIQSEVDKGNLVS